MLNNKLVVGVIGIGGIGVAHIKAAAECPNVAGVIACDIDEAVMEKNTADIKCLAKTTDWKEVIAREDVDAVIIDNEPAKAFVAANEGLTILDTEYAIEDYAIAVKKGNTEMLDAINAALEELTMDGTIDAIIAKYIKAE